MNNKLKKIVSSLLLASISSSIAYGYESAKKSTKHENMPMDMYYISIGLVPLTMYDANINDKSWNVSFPVEFEAHNKLGNSSNILTDLHLTSYSQTTDLQALSVGVIYLLDKLGDLSFGYRKVHGNIDTANINETQSVLPDHGAYFRYRTDTYLNNYKAEILWRDGDDMYTNSTTLSIQYMLSDKLSVGLSHEMIKNWGGDDLERSEISVTTPISKNSTLKVGFSHFDNTDTAADAEKNLGSFILDVKL